MKLLGLDVGGVLLRSPWELLLEQHPALLDKLPAALGPFSQGRDNAYNAFRAGSLSESDYWAHFSETLVRYRLEFRETKNPVRDLVRLSANPIRSVLREWLIEFSGGGGRVYTFSNGLYKNMGRAWSTANLTTDFITRHFDASETLIRKPDKRAFAPLLDEMQRNEDSSILYVDDNPHYVLAAEEAGVPGAVFSILDEGASMTLISSFFAR